MVAVLLLAGCSGGGEGKKAASSTTAPVPTTTVPAMPAGADPLTGLPPAGGVPARPALVVKIDNAPKARPQGGINEADVVVEEGVEGGVTRFAAIFHSKDSDMVGPVRSARSTDISIARQLNQPLFAYSGANAVFAKALKGAPIVDVGVGRFPTAYHREPGRPSPYNLFTATKPLFEAAPEDTAVPNPLFAYRAVGEAPPAAGSEPAGKVQAQWKGRIITTVVYAWDPQAKTFPRTEDRTPHLDAAGRQVAPENVVLQLVNYRDTGLKDTSGAPVPEAELVGTGDVWVLTGGRTLKGRWSRPNDGAITAYTDSAGNPIRLTPGRTWLELVPVGNLKAL